MKFETTLKDMRNSYYCVKFGYCDLQHLLNFESPIAYNSGTYGWNCDFYDLHNGLCLSTGYRPIGKQLMSYKRAHEYDVKAQKILYDYSIDYEDRKAMIHDLFCEFCDELVSAA